jgi:maltoporin
MVLARGACVAVAIMLATVTARADDPTSTQGPAPPAVAPAPAPAAPAPPAVVPATPAPTVSPNPNGTTTATTTAEHPAPDNGRFEFGSYGRVQVASDLRGGTGRPANIVSHGTRIDEDSYAELELRREDTFKDDVRTKVVATLALFPPFFHFSGSTTNSVAVRNLYAQATYGEYTLWVGSRMYRGDDIYLLDWWPLDNQNTVGGGVGVKLPTDTTVAAHVGMNRLDNDQYQYEQIQVPAPFGFGATNVTLLDRPRVVETLKVTQFLRRPQEKAGFKVILYGEAHELAAGVYQDPLDNQQRALPSDTGFLVGTELAYWTGERDTFVQLFMRHARGIAAYDPLAVPLTFANDRTTAGSTESLVALGANWEKDALGLLVGGYVRWFRDGDPSPTSTEKYDEGTLVARPQLYIGEHWGVAVEGSFQARRFAWIDPETNAPLSASMWRAGIMPYFSPSGRGSYKRPQLRLIYVASQRNAGARELYAPQDVFAQRQVEHYAGLSVEWWFNSSSYP